ncbi:phosphate propanoyltransferase [Clostridium fallax]|uniref:Phosphate propanoyltransferase n=1 Tax=Clostridium fallax TaxID=1533 RepID=A0A1M4XBW3_9CLOT|nr:phosphate propanoyltransferase [Clostridium fallax]SHE90786.1 putative phosphotransacetylase [Clostridium fallax]SQB05995.1 propanediol utilization protein [Clostridium fallax]
MNNECIINLIKDAVLNEIKEKNNNFNNIKVGVSGRHVHLSKEDLEILFGENYKLNIKKELMAGDFAAEETVTIVGDKLKAIEKVRVLGPTRKDTQVEISSTDAVFLGVKAPIRISGDIRNSAAITIIGPKGVVRKKEGCIIAKRHIHMSPNDRKILGIENSRISVRVKGERAGVLEDIEVRVNENYNLEIHIDTDEANALNIKSGDFVQLLT